MSSAIDDELNDVFALDGRRFRPDEAIAGGDVGVDTEFLFSERDGVVSASYQGGRVRLGFLVGVRTGAALHFRYAQLADDGKTATGASNGVLSIREDARLQLDEHWEWDSRAGSGTSRLIEFPAAGHEG